MEKENDLTEQQRLKLRYEQAHDILVAAEKQKTEQQLSISKDAAGHFEKLAVFCGGTIALVVSFLGGHKDAPLHWHILLPVSIWLLTGGMIAATARNVIYQYWAHRIFEWPSLQARREEQEARFELMAAVPNPVSMQTGEKLNRSEIVANMKKTNAGADALLDEWETKNKSLLNWWILSGRCAQALALLGVLCLVVLATNNI